MKTIKKIEISKEVINKFNPTIIKKDKDRVQYDFWKIVNFDKEYNEITVLDYVFNDTLHNDAFNGATGSKFDVISKAEYKERTSKDNVIDYIISSGFISKDTPKQLEYKIAEVYYKEMKANKEIDSFIFDDSYIHLHDYLRKELKLSKNEAFTFSCSGGGRCFEKGYKGNINPELSKVINQFEGK